MSFEQIFNQRTENTEKAHSRVNIIGEHTDYTGGYVMPTLLKFNTRIKISINKEKNYQVYSDHYKELNRKSSIEVLDVDFPSNQVLKEPLGAILVNKFLHHLKRKERQCFLQWSFDSLALGGKISIIDTDLEHQILLRSKDPEFRDKLIPGYIETLVDIEVGFCKNLEKDLREIGFFIHHVDIHDYLDETDAYSLYPGENLRLRFTGTELVAIKRSE